VDDLAAFIVEKHLDEGNLFQFKLHHKKATCERGSFDCIYFKHKEWSYEHFGEEFKDGRIVSKVTSEYSLRTLCEKLMGTHRISIKNRITFKGVPLGFFEHFGKLSLLLSNISSLPIITDSSSFVRKVTLTRFSAQSDAPQVACAKRKRSARAREFEGTLCICKL
jgi:hypothetical protein